MYTPEVIDGDMPLLAFSWIQSMVSNSGIHKIHDNVVRAIQNFQTYTVLIERTNGSGSPVPLNLNLKCRWTHKEFWLKSALRL